MTIAHVYRIKFKKNCTVTSMFISHIDYFEIMPSRDDSNVLQIAKI